MNGECVTIVKISVFCLSSRRNEVKKLFYVQFFTNLNFFLFDFNIAKMHIFCSVLKRLLLFQTKNGLYWEPILKKLIHDAGFKTEAQKFLMPEQCIPLEGIRKMI